MRPECMHRGRQDTAQLQRRLSPLPSLEHILRSGGCRFLRCD